MQTLYKSFALGETLSPEFLAPHNHMSKSCSELKFQKIMSAPTEKPVGNLGWTFWPFEADTRQLDALPYASMTDSEDRVLRPLQDCDTGAIWPVS